jgi:hypothetical protein
MLIKGLLLALCILRWNLEHFAHLHWSTCTKPVKYQNTNSWFWNCSESVVFFCLFVFFFFITTFGSFTTVGQFRTFRSFIWTINNHWTIYNIWTINNIWTIYNIIYHMFCDLSIPSCSQNKQKIFNLQNIKILHLQNIN